MKVWSRGAGFTYRFPTVAKAVRGLACDSALIDDEAVALREDGRSDFVAPLTKRGPCELLQGVGICRLGFSKGYRLVVDHRVSEEPI